MQNVSRESLGFGAIYVLETLCGTENELLR